MPRARKRQPRRRWSLYLLLLAVFPAGWIYYGLLMPLELPDAGYRLEVQKGSSFNQVIDALARDDVIPDALLAKLWLRLQPGSRVLHPGIWLLRPPQTTVSVLGMLQHANTQPVSRFTVVEGTTYRDLRRLLAAHDEITALPGSDAEVLAALDAPETHPEGLFAPDTYDIVSGDSELRILRALYQRQQRILAEEWEARAPDLPYASPYEALVMASIIEKETGVAHERAEIAGVFVRRLQKGMRLQTDPTVIYGMGERYEGRIRRADLLRASAYNTYLIDRLPPTPIALPGRAAIHAALHPAPGKAIFFVARGDGSHEFTATLAEHNRAVARYQKKRRADYRSTPAPEGGIAVPIQTEQP